MHPSEALANLLGDPLPADWRDALAVQARKDHLAALAYAAAGDAIEVILAYVEGKRLSSNTPPVSSLVDAVLALDKGWRRYTHETQRGDAGAIVRTSLNFWAGKVIGTYVENILERVRRDLADIVEDVVRERGIDDGGGR